MDGLIDRAKRGERAALEALVVEHYPRVYKFCARRLHADLASDAAQETFVTMLATIKRYRGDSRFEVWLLGIARNCCRNLARKRRADPLSIDAAWPEALAKSDGALDRVVLRAALSRLDPTLREVVLLHEVEGLTYAEIATVAEIPEGTVKSRLHRAFILLQADLAPKEKP